MYEFLNGNISELTPTYVIIDCGGVGYHVNISLQSFTQMDGKKNTLVFLHQVVREDAHLLYGFATKEERDIFRLLISVSGVGANTARVILSSMSVGEVQKAIVSGDINSLKQVKGIGLKTAQRLVVDLKDKMVGKETEPLQLFSPQNNTIRHEALSALVMLGFAKTAVEKVLDQLLHDQKDQTVEELIKSALKRL